MKIKELQYIINDLTDCQERIIEVDDWLEYCNQFYTPSKLSPTRSMPRNCSIQSIIQSDIKIEVEFYHPMINQIVIHRACVVDDSCKVGIIRQYRNFPKLTIEYSFGEEFRRELSEFSFKREYKCNFKKEVLK